MKILLITHNWRGEGTYVRAMMLGRELARRGHRVTLLGTSPNLFLPEFRREEGVCLVLAPHFRDSHRGGWGWLDIPFRAAWSLFHNFDLVHAFDHKPNVYVPAWIFRRLKGIPLVSDWADWWGKGGINAGARTWKAKVEEKLEEKVRRLAGWVSAISPVLAARARSLGIPGRRVLLLPGGGDLRNLKPADKAACRRALGLENGALVAVFMGLGASDLPVFLKGFALYLKHRPRARFLMLGPLPAQKMALAREAGCEAACLIPGRVPDAGLSRWLGAADFGVIPMTDSLANRARWPNKVGEYLAMGLPVLSNPVGPLEKLIRIKRVGRLVDATPEGFAGGLNSMARRQELKGMARRARRLAELELNWERLAKRLEGFYKKVLDQSKSVGP